MQCKITSSLLLLELYTDKYNPYNTYKLNPLRPLNKCKITSSLLLLGLQSIVTN